MKLAAVPSAMATVLAALLIVAPVLVGCSSTSQGTYTDAYGATYTGEWKDSMRHGQGTGIDANGTMYSGEWKDGQRHGHGTWKRADGYTYTGEWKDDTMAP